MLVFVSDLHLTDESFAPAIPLQRLIERVDGILQQGAARGVTAATLVLLGDIFEIIKSPKWLAKDNLRPWQSPTDAHRERVTEIYTSILDANKSFERWLQQLPTRFPFLSLRYIPGNHDLAINTEMGTTARRRLRQLLSQPASDTAFDTEFTDTSHSVLARHGHEWDRNNRAGPRGAPFGDAVVVDVLVRLPWRMAQKLGMRLDNDALGFLSEIDNVRPQTPGAMARWLHEGLDGLTEERRDAADAFDEVFDEILAELLRLAKTGGFEAYRYASLRSRLAARGAVKIARKGGIHRLMHLFPLSPDGQSHYAAHVRRLLMVGDGASAPRFFLCGHTHIPEHVPVSSGSQGLGRSLYLNTGTWRRVHTPLDVDRRGRRGSFSSHQEECIVTIFSPAEQKLGLPSYEFHRVTHGLD